MSARLTGPWVAHAGLDYACVMLPGDTTDTAAIEVHTDDPEERDDILRMISATPDLLRVAELLVSWLDEEVGAHKLCDAALAAIAKAKGRT